MILPRRSLLQLDQLMGVLNYISQVGFLSKSGGDFGHRPFWNTIRVFIDVFPKGYDVRTKSKAIKRAHIFQSLDVKYKYAGRAESVTVQQHMHIEFCVHL